LPSLALLSSSLLAQGYPAILDTSAYKVKTDRVSTIKLRDELRSRASNEKKFANAVLTSVPSSVIAYELVEREKTIYGNTDNRKDWWELSSRIKTLTDSVAAIYDADKLSGFQDEFILPATPLGTANNLCAGQRFEQQPSGARCSSFLVAPNVVATAGHCVSDATLSSARFVFGYRMDSDTIARVRIPKSDVFKGARIIRRIRSHFSDYALVELDRSAAPRAQLQIRKTGKVADNAPVSVLGYPSGLPVKYSDGAIVLDNSPSFAFLANLDTFGGNSGSPVFGTDNTVEGILVRGEVDYVPIPNSAGAKCNVAYYCPDDQCAGELVTRSTAFGQFIP